MRAELSTDKINYNSEEENILPFPGHVGEFSSSEIPGP